MQQICTLRMGLNRPWRQVQMPDGQRSKSVFASLGASVPDAAIVSGVAPGAFSSERTPPPDLPENGCAWQPCPPLERVTLVRGLHSGLPAARAEE